MGQPIFYDASGSRSRWSKRILAAILALIVLTAIGFAWTIAAVPAAPALLPVGERSQARPLIEQVSRLPAFKTVLKEANNRSNNIYN
jgi:hypothetical protein